MNLKIINNDAFLDEDSHTVSIQFDRVTFTMLVEEFLEFYTSVSEIKDFFDNSPDYVFAQEKDIDSGSVRGIIMPKPDEDDYT
jgi:hypothetical protein